MASRKTCEIAALVVGMLITGTVNTLTTNIQLKTESRNKDGEMKMFEKPWFGAFNMLLAMAAVGLVDKCFRLGSRGAVVQPETEVGLLDETAQQKTYTEKVLLVAFPAAFDLLATAACCIGMMYIPASVWQMLRGSSLVFVAILSITFLRRRLLGFHYLGLFLCVTGILLVAAANVLGGKKEGDSDKAKKADAEDPELVVFGMLIVLFGQVLQAAQVIAEEWLMKDVDLPAMEIVGWEGVWGIIIMLLVVYPVLYFVPGKDHGHMEDPVDTLVMIGNSGKLMVIVLIYLVSCATFNAVGIKVTGALSAVHRMMMDASRTAVIWSFGLIVHCVDPSSKFGEVWTIYSYLQLAGFFVLLAGQSVYGGILRISCCTYPKEEPVNLAQFASPASINLFSPLPPRRDSDE